MPAYHNRTKTVGNGREGVLESVAKEYSNTKRTEREVAEIELKMYEFIKSHYTTQGFSPTWSSDRGFYMPCMSETRSYQEREAVGFLWTTLGIQNKALEVGWNGEILCDENGKLI